MEGCNVVGVVLGTTVGDGDGCAVGRAEGDTVGERVGASVLSQQLKNVAPSAAGQHAEPGIVNPMATHRWWDAQSACVVGLALGFRDGYKLDTFQGKEGDLVGISEGFSGSSMVAQHAAFPPSASGQHSPKPGCSKIGNSATHCGKREQSLAGVSTHAMAPAAIE